jgi:hypothetical protein
MTAPKDTTKQRSDDFDTALTAMRRAAEVAKQRARRRNGVLVAWRDGRIIEEQVAPRAEAERRG